MTRRTAFASVLAAALLLGVGEALAADYTIVLDKMAFGPVPRTLHPGDTITWRNDDVLHHTATAKDGSFDIDLPSKVSVKMTVGAAGKVPFFCKFHPGMTGMLVITP